MRKGLLCCVCAVLLCTVLVVQAGDPPASVSNTTAVKGGETPLTVKGTQGSRQGGDTCELATVIPSLPYTDSGTTEGYEDDYDVSGFDECPNPSDSPDVVYVYTPTADGTLNITLCVGDSNYNTKLIVADENCEFARRCNDDACSAPNYPQQLVSRLESVVVYAGVACHIMVDGAADEFGLYTIEVEEGDPLPPPIPIECPSDGSTMYGQLGHGPSDPWTFVTSDTGTAYTVYDNFGNLTADIASVHWWGVDLMYDNGWTECDEDPTQFEIKFYNDDGSNFPVHANPVCTYNVMVAKQFIGAYGPNYFGWHYSTTLSPACSLTEGWMSIRGSNGDNCWFLWLDAPPGDMLSYQQLGAVFEERIEDMGFCLCADGVPPAPPTGACCDEASGNCQDNIAAPYCYGKNRRFAANTLCVNLQPPCTPSLGACCVDGICIADMTEPECVGSLGEWYPGESCFATPPFVCPPPPPPPDCTEEGNLFAQAPNPGETWQTAYTCETIYSYYAYESFTASAPICSVEWFGLDLEYSGGWIDCDMVNPSFIIKFYPDDGGQPLYTNPTSFTVYPDMETVPNQAYNGYPLKYFVANIDPCVNMTTGWVDIAGSDGDSCLFLWMDSSEGDGSIWRRTTGAPVIEYNDVNLCLNENAHGGTVERGDLNCDGVIDAFDIDPFVLALTNPPQYVAQYPNCNIMNGDINCDGAVDSFDIDGFVQCIVTGTCPPCP